MLVYHFFIWLLGFIFINSLRWKILLKAIDVRLRTTRAAALTAIGLFFNSFLPGSVSGDAVKAYYIIKDQEKISKTSLLFSVLLDRVLAFYGLFMIACFCLFSFFSIQDIIKIKALSFPLIFVFSILSLGFILIYIVPFDSLKQLKIFNNKTLNNILVLVYNYKKKPYYILQVIFYAFISQGLFFLYFAYITSFFNDLAVNWNKLFIIYPLGIVSTIIPLAPGGLGVGHATFDALFQYFDLKEGANIFNLFFIGSLAFNLLGLIPYLIISKEK